MRKNYINRISIVILVSLLSGCGIYRKYQPVTQVPDDLFGNLSTDTAGIGTLQWKEVFTDSYLQALIDSALTRNTDLRIARLKMQEADAALLSSRLSYLPSFAFSPEGSISKREGAEATQVYSLPVTASWELDIFGRSTNAKRGSQMAFEQSKEYVRAVQTQLIATVANNYYTLLMLDAQLKISIETEKSWQESIAATRAMRDFGLATEAGLAQAEAACEAVSASVIDLKEQINRVENALSLLTADTPHRIIRGNIDNQHFPEYLAVGVPVQILSNRPDVRGAEFALAEAFYATNGARAAFYPSVTLGGNAGWTDNIGSAIVNPAQFLSSAVLSLVQPLFNRGRNIAQLRIAKARQEEARLVFTQTLLNAGSEVNDALVHYQTAHEKSAHFDNQIKLLEKAVGSTLLLMQHGNTNYIEVLTARQSLLEAQLVQTANRIEEMQSVITLYHALGGGGDYSLSVTTI